LVSKSFNVTGTPNGVVAHFDLWINLTDDTLVVNIDNALAASNSAKVGTITGIGFNTPFAIASQTGDNPGTVAFKAKWTVGSAQGLANNVWSNDDYWTEETPYHLSPSYNEDYGVTAPTPNYGIEYGEKATFYFKFTQDINLSNIAGFFDNKSTTTNPFDFTVRWQEVDTKYNYENNCGSNPGSDKGGIDLGFSPQGDIPPTPEPSTYGLIGGAAMVGLVLVRRRQIKAKKAA
jgi:hypothetical protein